MNRVLYEDPFEKDKFKAEKPLYAALVPDEIFKGSHFERRFVTPFGSVWEDLAVAAADFGLGKGVKGYSIFGSVKAERLRQITEILSKLEHPPKKSTSSKARLGGRTKIYFRGWRKRYSCPDYL